MMVGTLAGGVPGSTVLFSSNEYCSAARHGPTSAMYFTMLLARAPMAMPSSGL